MRIDRLHLAVLAAVVTAAVAFLVAGAAPAAGQEDEPALTDDYCLGCHAEPGQTTTLPNGDTLDLSFDVGAWSASVHAPLGLECTTCHTDIGAFPHDPITAASGREYTIDANAACISCHGEQAMENADDVHRDALAEGNLEAAVCTDCHGAHDVMGFEPHDPAIPLTCGTCHGDIYGLYAESVHGESLISGNRDVPTCIDCHGVHEVRGPSSDHPFRLFSPQICAECHADDDLMDRYGISTNVFESYVADFHGSTVSIFEEIAPDQEANTAVCIDRHGVHAIRSEDDPDSTVFKQNLLRTCQRCHPDATENFPASWLSHYEPSLDSAPVVFGVDLFYKIVIPLIIGSMVLYVALDIWGRRTRDEGEAADG